MDTLHLFPPAIYSSLPGWPLPPWSGEDNPDAARIVKYLAAHEERYQLAAWCRAMEARFSTGAATISAPSGQTTTQGLYYRYMTMLTPRDELASEAEALTAAACLFHGFSDPTRLAILRHLALGEHRVVDLVAHVGLAQSTVSKHLACLRDCGLVSSRPQGRASVYSLTHTATTMRLFAAADELLGATGEAVVLCEHYGAATLHEPLEKQAGALPGRLQA